MKAEPNFIELNEADLYAKLDRIEAALGADVALPFRQLLGAYITVLAILRDKNISLKRLRKLIFGSSSERSSKIFPQTNTSGDNAVLRQIVKCVRSVSVSARWASTWGRRIRFARCTT
jgi:hypothetical protein